MEWKRFWEKVTNWELWPFELRYFAIAPVWLWYCLRSRSFWFFTSSNPTLTFGGFEGEDKREMYNLLPEASYPKTIYIYPHQSFEEVKKAITDHGFTYPFCVKPDVGMKGLLFRKIDKEDQLRKYHQQMPVDYIVQELVTYPVEASVFYFRYPDQQKGVITGFIRKQLMEVVGDGKKTIGQLIQEHSHAKHRLDEMRIKHEEYLDTVLPQGETYFLTYAANLSRGARFVNLDHLIDGQLQAMFDVISHQAKFYYGRYDLKCQSIEDLKQGKNFTILEFNGSGAEPNHVYHNNLRLWQAYKVILMHWKVLFQISRYNHLKGIRYWSFKKGWNFLQASKKHLKVLEAYDTKILV